MNMERKGRNRIVSMQLNEDELAMLSRRLGERNRSEYLRDVLRRDLEEPTQEDELKKCIRELGEEIQGCNSKIEYFQQKVLQELFWVSTWLQELSKVADSREIYQETMANVEAAMVEYRKSSLK